MGNILEKITRVRLDRLAGEKKARSIESLERRAIARKSPPDFFAAFQGPGIHVIAEVKRASPSKGILNKDLDVAATARSYEQGGACAISVLTEEDHFLGSLAILETVRSVASLPVLRKDFIVDSYQIVEARASGADSFLLIAALLEEKPLQSLIAVGRKWGMEPLVEVHDLSELETALSAGARVVGVNNRDLKTFHVDLQVTLDVMKHVPDNVAVISESGIKTRDDILRLADAGVKGFLVGESIVTAPNPSEKIRELIGADASPTPTY
jgi:indole-3-glycerol phosphate synthase